MLVTLIFTATLINIFAQDLRKGFANPLHSDESVVWWHWKGSNITREGITKDLEWMKRTFQTFEVYE